MTLFKRSSWTPDDIPNLTFRRDRLWVDIGFLAGNEHRTAFAQIFARMLSDNKAALSGMEVVAIEAARAVPLTVNRLPAALSAIDVTAFANSLYDSRNEEVILELIGPQGEARLGVKFDDPEFWLEGAAA